MVQKRRGLRDIEEAEALAAVSGIVRTIGTCFLSDGCALIAESSAGGREFKTRQWQATSHATVSKKAPSVPALFFSHIVLLYLPRAVKMQTYELAYSISQRAKCQSKPSDAGNRSLCARFSPSRRLESILSMQRENCQGHCAVSKPQVIVPPLPPPACGRSAQIRTFSASETCLNPSFHFFV